MKTGPFSILSGILFLCCCILVAPSLKAQQLQSPVINFDSSLKENNLPKNSCGTDILLNRKRKDPAFVLREQRMNEAIQKALTGNVKLDGGSGTTADPYVLPVVFHIINATGAIAITDAQVANAVKDLNDAFSKSGAYAASAGADTKIRFALAQKDPDGGITNGINRVTSPYQLNMNMNIEDFRLKNLIQWDPTKYINIWVVNNIIGEISATFGCGVWTRMNAGGYATMPSSVNSTSSTEGIVVTGFGPLLAHEMGHYLGLYHTFEGGCTNNDCTKDGDKVCDTPPDGTTNKSPSCTNPINSCITDTLSNHSNGFFPLDVPDQISNFMDYNNAGCANQFTEGQATRMRAAIATQRPGLINDLMNKPCADNILAAFTRNISDPKVGDQVNFTNTSQNTSNYEWLIDGASKSTSKDFSNTFTAAGKFKVTLKANANAGCNAVYSDFVIVNCGVTARFYGNKQLIASKDGVLNDTILFVNNSVNNLGGSNSYQWIISDGNGQNRNTITSNAVGGGPNDLNYSFPTPGVFLIKLIATNGGCVDSTLTYAVNVLDPTPNATMGVFGVTCFQETKIRVNFYACDNGYKPIFPNLPISFYDADPRKAGAVKLGTTYLIKDTLKGYCCGKVYTDTIDVQRRGLNQLYAVVNDTGNAIPIALPNTSLVEKSYTDNVTLITNFRFRVTPIPTVATLKPGDVLQLTAQTSPDPTFTSQFAWSTPTALSCVNCVSPTFTADSTRTKRVIATSQYQCYDTAYVTLNVVQPDDYTVKINSVDCTGKDSLSVSVTVTSTATGGGIPKKLPVAIYKGDPSTAGAVLLGPQFLVPDSLTSPQTYSFKVKSTTAGKLYATVNSSSTAVPVSFATPPFFEKVTSNNISPAYTYSYITQVIDTTICNGDTVLGRTVTGSYSDTFTTARGCDSVRILNLTVRAASVTKTTVNIAVCAGQSYAGYTAAGTYVNVFTGSNGCDSIRTLNLTVNPVARTTNNIQICRGNTYFAGGALQSVSGTYVDSLKTTAGCDSIVTTVLTVNPLPVNFLPQDTVMCIGKTLPLILSYPTVTWSDGSTGGSFTISQPGTYGAQVVDRNGCAGSDQINVTYIKCIPIQIPSAFTPNKDGKNDVFRPLIGAPVTNYKMQIWNRWGQLMFETRDYSKGWNGDLQGEQQQNGVYIYFFSFTDPDGVDVMKKGTLLLIR
jgi:gliding motility-associated-like protein